MARGYFGGGGRVFVSITDTRDRAVDSITSHTCVLVKDYDEAIELVGERLNQSRFWLDEVDIFTKPRLCEKCMELASFPMAFDDARFKEECLHWMEGTFCEEVTDVDLVY